MIRGYAVQEPFGWSVALSIVMHPAEGDFDNKPRILRLAPRSEDDPTIGIASWEEVEPHAQVQPTMRLNMDVALVLADALSELRHGSGEVRALRADYDAERARVDKLLETLSSVATGPAR